MQATFTKALYYRVQFTCVTPMRIGVFMQDKKDLLRRKDGSVFLPSGSIAGAFRAWKKNNKLLGSQEKGSELIISDGVFQKSKAIYRHRIALSNVSATRRQATGTALANSHQDIAVLPQGTTGEFSMVWKGLCDFSAITPVIEAYLAALDDGQIHLGSGRCNDFGRVRLSVSRGCYDMTDYAQRKAWLSRQWNGSPISLPAVANHSAVFNITAAMPKIFVDSASGKGHHRENHQWIVPSSSIKGVLLRWCSLIAPTLDAGDVIPLVFGSPYSPAKQPAGPKSSLVVSDGTYDNAQKLTAFNRMRMDPALGIATSVMQNAPWPISGDLRFQLRINASCSRAIGLLLYALRDFGLGMFDLGSNHAIGWGYADGITVRLSTRSGTGTMCVADGTVRLYDPESVIADYMKNIGGSSYDSNTD